MLPRKTYNVDFCVIGGGLAGICAAISAARNGCKVVLMHERPVLGGNASSEVRMWVCGADGENNRETGILEEIFLENLYRNPTKNYYIWDTILYEFVKREKNITLLLNCTCIDAKTCKGSFSWGRTIKIISVSGYQMTTQTFFDVKADYFSDCSGDSILAPLTGASYRVGRESADEFNENTDRKTQDKLTMGMSCLIGGRETTKNVDFISPDWASNLNEKHFEKRKPNIYYPAENFWYLELGGNKDTIHDTEEIKDELIPLALGTWNYIKNSKKYDADTWELDFLGFLPGKRESRRMVGEYIIKQPDISNNVIFEDTIAFGGWPLDDHVPLGFYYHGAPNSWISTPAPYTIPYRALYSENVSNLFFAGRNISMTHMAMSSIRVMATCALLGQAVGTSASLAVKYKINPNDIYKYHIKELQEMLMNSDCFLPHFQRKISDSCLSAHLTGATDSIRDGCDRPHKIYNKLSCGDVVTNNSSVKYELDDEVFVNSVHIVFDSDLERKTLPGDENERKHATRSNILLSSPSFSMPLTLCKSYELYVTSDGKEEKFECTMNKKRCIHLDISKKVTQLRLVITSNWGGTDKTGIFSFDFN